MPFRWRGWRKPVFWAVGFERSGLWRPFCVSAASEGWVGREYGLVACESECWACQASQILWYVRVCLSGARRPRCAPSDQWAQSTARPRTHPAHSLAEHPNSNRTQSPSTLNTQRWLIVTHPSWPWTKLTTLSNPNLRNFLSPLSYREPGNDVS